MIADFKSGVAVAMGVEHPHYRVVVEEIAPQVQAALAKDFA
jgi:hypothetical protein